MQGNYAGCFEKPGTQVKGYEIPGTQVKRYEIPGDQVKRCEEPGERFAPPYPLPPRPKP